MVRRLHVDGNTISLGSSSRPLRGKIIRNVDRVTTGLLETSSTLTDLSIDTSSIRVFKVLTKWRRT